MLSFVELTNYTHFSNQFEKTVIRILNTSPSIDILSLYRIPGYILSQTEWDNITNLNGDNNLNTILVGDFNAHHIKWNCRHSDCNGERLDHSIDNNNIFLVNSNSNTHINVRSNSMSNIDLLLHFI